MTQRQRDPSRSEPEDALPDDFLYHLYRGSELLADGRFDASREELEVALRMQPRDPSAQDLLARLYFRLGLYPRAIEIYQEIVKQFPERPAPRVNLALAFLKTGQLRDVVSQLLPVIERDPEHGRAWGYLGLAWWRLDELAKAREAFLRAGHEGMARRMDQELEARAASGASSAVSLAPSAVIPAAGTHSIPPPAPTPHTVAPAVVLDASALEPSVANTSLRSPAVPPLDPRGAPSASVPPGVPGLHDGVPVLVYARAVALPSLGSRGRFELLAGGELRVAAGAGVRLDDDAIELRGSAGPAGDDPALRPGHAPFVWLQDGWVLVPPRPGLLRVCLLLRVDGGALRVRSEALLAVDETVSVQPSSDGDLWGVQGDGRIVLEAPAPGLRAVQLSRGETLEIPTRALVALSGAVAMTQRADGHPYRSTLRGEGLVLVAPSALLGHSAPRHG